MKTLVVVCAAVALLAELVEAVAASNVVRYTYDAAGNLVAIGRVDPAPLSISGFMPPSGPIGTLVTITGSGFSDSPGANAVRFNGVSAAVSSASTVALTATVPAGAGSGKIAVVAAADTATSAQDFVVTAAGAPSIPGIADGDIIATTTVAADGPAQTLGLLATNKYGLLLFEGKAGDWLSVQVADFAVNPAGATIGYALYKPDLTRIASGTLSAGNLSIHLPPLPAAGRYALLLATGNAQVSLDVRLETDRIIPADGTPLAVTRGAGQHTRALLAATTGEQKALMVSALAVVPSGTSLDWAIALPSGSTWRRGSAVGLGTTTLLPPFTATATQTIVLTPTAAATQSAFKLALLPGVALIADGAATDVVIAGPGEGARLNFAGAAGDNLGLGLTRLALDPKSAASVSFAVFKPDATQLAAGVCRIDGWQCSANLALPAAGNYSVVLQPADGASGSMQAWLSRDAGGSLTSGQPLAVALTRPGQNARLTFTGTAGSVIALQARAVATNPAGQGLLVMVYAPGGALHAYMHVNGAGATMVTPPLPAGGTYTVLIEPEPAAQGAATASLNVLLDPGRELLVDGPTQSASLGVAGSSARFNFTGTAGQNLGFGASAMNFAGAADATVTVYKPDASTLAAFGCMAAAGRCAANLGNLPATGTYALVVRPNGEATGSIDLTLSRDVTQTFAPGSALALVLDRPGANARLNFSGVAAQPLRLSWTSVAMPETTAKAIVTLVGPNGSTLGSTALAAGIAGAYDIPALPSTGNYTVFVDPPAGVTMSATLMLTPR